MSTPRKDHLKYLQYLTDHQYDYSDEPEPENVPDDAWIWADPPAKEKMKNVTFNGIVDASNLRKDQIKAAIGRTQNIQIGSFSIRLSGYYGKDPLQQGLLSFEVYNKVIKTPNGHPCNMDVHADLSKDNRFADRPWLSYFKGSSARDVPIDTIVEIIRWMQAVKKLSAFL